VKSLLLTSTFAAALLLGACGRDDGPAGAEADSNAAANGMMANGMMANGMMDGMDGAMANDMMAMSGPFADTERSMHRTMMAAVGADLSDSWVKKMIAHHEGAVAMARAYLAQAGADNAAAKAIARKTIDKQTREIAELRKLEKSGASDASSAQPYRDAEMQMMRAMMDARRDDVDESFLRKMLAHHKGGIALSDVVISRGTDQAVKAKAQKTAEDQRKESGEIEKTLAG